MSPLIEFYLSGRQTGLPVDRRRLGTARRQVDPRLSGETPALRRAQLRIEQLRQTEKDGVGAAVVVGQVRRGHERRAAGGSASNASSKGVQRGIRQS